MKPLRILVLVVVLLSLSWSVLATTFIVPDDREMIAKSEAIVRGTVLRAWPDDSDPDFLRTFYEMRLERVLKGDVGGADRILTVASPGGVSRTGFMVVHGAAHFREGDDVLLFLTWHRGAWTPTDMTLGAFRFALSTGGRGMLLREADDIAGWTRSGKVHHERVRSEIEFTDFIDKSVHGRSDTADYFVDNITERAASPGRFDAATDAEAGVMPNVYPAASHTYSVSFHACDLTRFPGRRENMGSGVGFFKNSAQDAMGLGDGGIQVITDALASWTDDCPSAVNINYAGEAPYLNANDGYNTVIFNDPGNHVSGSWQGSGTIAIAFSRGGFTHTFDGVSWVSISDSDVVFQNGYAGTELTMGPAMVHEIGHGIGLRHADRHYLPACNSTSPISPCSISCAAETACVGAEEECSAAGTAIMTASVSSSYGYTLKTWDQHAAVALYPGGSCANVRGDANGDNRSDVFFRDTTSGQNAIWFMDGVGFSSSALLPSVSGATMQMVAFGDINGDARGDVIWRNQASGENAVWFMNGAAFTGLALPTVTGDLRIYGSGDFNGDSFDDLVWRNDSNGEIFIWLMNASGLSSGVFVANPGTAFTIVGVGDLNADGRADIILRDGVSGTNAVWFMNGGSFTGVFLPSLSGTNYRLAATGDFNADGRFDFFWRDIVSGDNAVWLMNGASILTGAFLPNVSSSLAVVACGDYDADGKYEVFWRDASSGVNAVWLLNGASLSTGGFVSTVAPPMQVTGAK